ncbi:MAG: hypothetical protein ACTSXP_16630 [Promethearchaeota archaeon]
MICPKCSGTMKFKRLNIHEFKRTFLITIAECTLCKFWIQNVDLQLNKLLPVKTPNFYYDLKDWIGQFGGTKVKDAKHLKLDDYKNSLQDDNDIVYELLYSNQNIEFKYDIF